MTLRRNVAANLVGRAWVTVLGIAFVPVYLRFLGMEAYGLVGLFATLQAVFGILDLGLGATINRELARFSAGEGRCRDQQTILRTLEVCHWTISLLAGALVFVLAPAIANDWVQPEQLTTLTVERAVRLMGIVLALQLPLSFYQAALMGLQRQVPLNAVLVMATTARTAGTALVLWQVSSSVEAFFISQAAVSALQAGVTLRLAWTVVGGIATTKPEFARLASVWRYAGATSANAIIGIALTQLDKVLLSRLLTLEHFGYYVLAGTVASFVWAIALPVNQALFPRFAQLFELKDEDALTALYHRASQVMAVSLVPAAATVVCFAWHVIWLWTHNTATADHTSVVAALLIVGTTLNALTSVPAYLQAAAGWPALMTYTNGVAALVLVPAILIVTPAYGALGAAFVWLVLNAGYLFLNVPLMHRRLLRGEQWRWYRDDVARATIGAVAMAATGRVLMPASPSMFWAAVWIAGVWALASAAAAILAPAIRPELFRRFAPAGASVGV